MFSAKHFLLDLCLLFCVCFITSDTFTTIKIQKVASFIQLFKFFTNDPRKMYSLDTDKTFASHFPSKPVKIKDHPLAARCEAGLDECVQEIYETAGQSPRILNSPRNSITKDEFYAKPFDTKYDMLKYQTIAAYYMCYYTIRKEPDLEKFGGACVIKQPWTYEDASTKDRLVDYRDQDQIEYGCALMSFCPDPCCGKVGTGIINEAGECWADDHNPCKGISDDTCEIYHDDTVSIDYIRNNRLTARCHCESHEFWNKKISMCADRDECLQGAPCPKDKACVNTAWDDDEGYICVCREGTLYDWDDETCKPYESVLTEEQPDEETDDLAEWVPLPGGLIGYGKDPIGFISHSANYGESVHRTSKIGLIMSVFLCMCMLCYLI